MLSPIRNKTVYAGLMLSVALILSYVETLISLDGIFPGVKLGLSNFAVVVTLYVFGPGFAFFISVTKVLLSTLLFGNMASAIYGFSGALLSFAVMIVLYHCNGFHTPVVSAAGGVFHNIGQFLTAVFVTGTFVPGFYLLYIPILIFFGFVSGFFTGLVAGFCIPYIKRIIIKGDSKL